MQALRRIPGCIQASASSHADSTPKRQYAALVFPNGLHHYRLAQYSAARSAIHHLASQALDTCENRDQRVDPAD